MKKIKYQRQPIIWTCTDPDNYQYGRKVFEGVYQFKEFDRLTFGSNLTEVIDEAGYEAGNKYVIDHFDDADFWIEKTIVLATYAPKTIEHHVKGYYASMNELETICGGDKQQVDWITAECIFEQNNGLY